MEAFLARPLACLPPRAVTLEGTLSAAPGWADDGGEDRISALPDDLRRNIVSRLPVKDAVRTTALSTRWRRVWHSTPLVLYDAHLDPDDEPAAVAAADRVLAAHPGPFQTVHLARFFFDEHERELARWPPILADRHVRDLALVSLPGGMEILRLPDDILRCADLERLYLGFWTFPDTAALPDGAGAFPHLRELAMINTLITDRDLDHMLAASPVLETLALVGIAEAKHVRLRGRKLQCVLFWLFAAAELALVDAPLLERLILWDTTSDKGVGSLTRVKIAQDSPELKVLGYLEPRIHELQIGNTVIKADTKVSPRSMVPSVKILALRVNFGVFKEVQMLVNFLRCFPNIETLHVESAISGEPTGKHYFEFFKDLSPVECVRSRIKMVVVHEFHGDLSELAFLKYISQRANELQKLMLVLSLPDQLRATLGQIEYALEGLAIPPWACERCMVLLMGRRMERDLDFNRASDRSVDDPFLEHGLEFYRLVKERE
ncbi:hypothetical protein ACP70R_037265 [Stipagrostis hirtigluma subsp. patula]